ncbi:sporulation protein YjcZ [Sporosarcina sp. P18a]|uniref:YjcZ family sporulation protein n=1 Tax=unclassified Sporosarcina TaxID=2647733 RepID=UPI000C16E245|nr:MULTISPECIES: YjcZ family sporulation protein [unclassified Sporosarcina]PIC69455.1 sporulation protein YjcZ [Sporosarcina sp. P16b]PIC81611.1 sporulation protein YjcZ [Sporosarcina sp. P18a]
MFGFGGYGYGGGGYGGSGCDTGGSGESYRSCGNGFALIVVLFILLIIVGAACL